MDARKNYHSAVEYRQMPHSTVKMVRDGPETVLVLGGADV
jgi:hypothetical protein